MNLLTKQIITYTFAFTIVSQHQMSMAFDLGLEDLLKTGVETITKTVTTGNGQEKSGEETSETSMIPSLLGCGAFIVIAVASKGALEKAADKLAKGNKQKKNQFLLGMALGGCALAGKLTNSVYSKISQDAKNKINEDMITAANTGETIEGVDPQNANIKYEISQEEKEYKEIIAGKEKTCKIMRSVVDDQSDTVKPETALVRQCIDIATGKYKPEPVTV